MGRGEIRMVIENVTIQPWNVILLEPEQECTGLRFPIHLILRHHQHAHPCDPSMSLEYSDDFTLLN